MGQSQLNFVLNPDIGIWEQWKIKFVKQATQLTASLEMLCLRTWWTPTAGSTPLLRNLSTKLFSDEMKQVVNWSGQGDEQSCCRGWERRRPPRSCPPRWRPRKYQVILICHLLCFFLHVCCICLFACWENQVILSIILFFGFSLLPQKIRLSFSFFAILILELNFPSSWILLHFDEQAPQVLPVGLLHPLLPGHPLLYTQVPHLYYVSKRNCCLLQHDNDSACFPSALYLSLISGWRDRLSSQIANGQYKDYLDG